MTDAPTTGHPGTTALPTPAVTVRRATPADADESVSCTCGPAGTCCASTTCTSAPGIATPAPAAS